MGHLSTLAGLVREEYHASSPSTDCVRAVLDFVENTPHSFHSSPVLMKHLLKVSTKIPAAQLTIDQLSRLHVYGHQTASRTRDAPHFSKLRAHLYRDAADIVQKQYLVTEDVALAQEALADYRRAAYGVGANDPAYALTTLAEGLLFAVRVSSRTGICDFVDQAMRDVARFPKGNLPTSAVRYASNAIEHARTVAARVRSAKRIVA